MQEKFQIMLCSRRDVYFDAPGGNRIQHILRGAAVGDEDVYCAEAQYLVEGALAEFGRVYQDDHFFGGAAHGVFQ